MKNIAVLGSTGSIGTQTLEVAAANPEELKVTALAAGRNIRLLEEQIRRFHPLAAAVWDEKDAALLRTAVADLDVKIYSGMEGLIEISTMKESDVLVTAIVGMIGIRPTIAAIEGRKRHCPGKQRDSGDGGTSDYASGGKVRCSNSSRGQ